MTYFKRLIENKINTALKSIGTLVIAGPKLCGKTTTAKEFSKSFYSLDSKAKIELCQMAPEAALIGENPRLVEKWQNVLDLWNVVRSEIDKRDN